jgi:protein TonB
VRVDLGAAGLTDDVRGEDLVSPGPDPAHQNIPPRYPRDAVARGEKGIVALFVKVAPTGEVEDAEVVQSSGHESLDDAARAAVLRWRFIPARRDGLAIESGRVESFNFE